MRPPMNPCGEIAVLGAGPAGAAVACGLAKLGYRVQLFGGSRNVAIEGLSERTLAQLRAAGLDSAAACVRGPGSRKGSWAGQVFTGSQEYIVERAAFDAALRTDAASRGVVLQAECVIGLDSCGRSWRVHSGTGIRQFRAVVDARGRRSRGVLLQGPRLLSISQRLRARRRGRGDAVRTGIYSIENEWCWIAEDGRGTIWLQIVGDSRPACASRKFTSRIAGAIASIPAIAARFADCDPAGPPYVRPAVARMAAPTGARGMVRAGDASVAADPLSGHGIYEALTSATVAIAAVHTYLEKDEWEIVQRFCNERAQEVWRTAVSAAARFYRAPAECTTSPFWGRTAAEYATLCASMRQSYVGPPGIVRRPVLNGVVIELQPVVLTAEQPRGVWKVDSVELVRLVEVLRADPRAGVPSVAERLARPREAVERAVQWLAARGLIESRADGAQESRRFGARWPAPVSQIWP